MLPFDDEPAGAGGVVRRQERPRSGPQVGLGLTEGLDVGVDPFDVLEPIAGQRREAQLDGDDDLGSELEVVLEQEVVVLADGPVDAVLDRDHPGHGPARLDLVEDVAEPRQPDAVDLAERRPDGVLGEGPGLTGERDPPAGRHDRRLAHPRLNARTGRS